MTTNVPKRTAHRPGHEVELILRLQGLGDPAISDYIAKTRAKYGKFSLPIEEARRIVDASMGEHTLSQVLHEMREDGY